MISETETFMIIPEKLIDHIAENDGVIALSHNSRVHAVFEDTETGEPWVCSYHHTDHRRSHGTTLVKRAAFGFGTTPAHALEALIVELAL